MSGSRDILALHGNLGSPEDWSAAGLPAMRAVDLWDFAELDFHEFAAELAGPLSAGMERPTLVGYSLGGRLALHALALHPQRWGGAVVLAAHPGLRSVEERIARRRSDADWAERARTWPWGEFLADWNGQALFDEASEALLARQHALEARREAVAAAFERWSLGRQADLRPALRAYVGPVRWITGARDGKFTRIAGEMAKVFPDFHHHIVPGRGHRLLESAPEVVPGAIADCLARIRRSG